jgi:hypothetical protein
MGELATKGSTTARRIGSPGYEMRRSWEEAVVDSAQLASNEAKGTGLGSMLGGVIQKSKRPLLRSFISVC